MHISFRQLKLFLALADTGSVSAAAKAMHVTQPTASMQLKEITLAVGLPLYEVISKKIYLTDTGKQLANTARDMLACWEVFSQNVDATRGLTRGKLKVAVVSTAKYFMPRLIGGFCKNFPDIDVSLEILNRDGVVKRMRDNLDDIYIMSQPPVDIDLADEVFMVNPLVPIATLSADVTSLAGTGWTCSTTLRAPDAGWEARVTARPASARGSRCVTRSRTLISRPNTT